MLRLTHAIPYTLAAILAVTLLTAIGALLSRKYNFNFAYLSILSFSVYILLGYFVGSVSNLSTAILAGLITGFYDATACWKIAVLLKANFGLSDDEMENLTVKKGLTIMLFVAPFFVYIGFLFR